MLSEFTLYAPNSFNNVRSNSVCCHSLGDHVSVSGPEGTFSLRPLRDTTVLYLLAAGTGFTPMSRLIRVALHESFAIRSVKNKRQQQNKTPKPVYINPEFDF